MNAKAYWLGLLLLLTSFPLLAQMNTYTLDTRHQLASDLVPTLKELLPPGGSVTSFNNVLIIKTTADNFTQLQNIIEQLDTPIRQLMVSVTQDERIARNRRSLQVDGSLRAGDGEISLGDPEKDRLSIDYGTRSRNNQGTQRVRTLEGQPAFVQIGQQVPVTSTNGWNSSTQYQSVVRGFYVTVRVRDKVADVTIETRNDRLQTGGGQTPQGARPIDTQGATTRVQVRLGEWIAIGQLDEDSRQSDRQLNRRSDGTLSRRGSFYLKVDEI
ncbi:secretin N-terminal domain-containing protein [Aestuariirhabdus litorea]|nr:secretin N-terminal domain-containing protein [Aestuariirhabdus litorea]